MLAIAATIGALFDTPVAAALIFTGMAAALPGAGALWDKLFLPLVAAGAGSITMTLLGAPPMDFGTPAYPGPHPLDLLTGTIIACASVLIAMIAVIALPPIHKLFHSLRNPVLYATLGGLVLGLLGALGGRITLFKGLEQAGQLIHNADAYGFGALLAIALIKIAALVIGASAGFRGGRIFPAVFIGVALGLAAHALVPSIPIALAVGCGAMGTTLAIARDGWVAIFIGFVASGSLALLPLLCLISLPAWLLVSRAPQMIVNEPEPVSPK
jgi:H+/Cl- antiporter ClcA